MGEVGGKVRSMDKKIVLLSIVIFSLVLGMAYQQVELREIKASMADEPPLFKNQTELKAFLATDMTDSHTYLPERFDCDDFTLTLINNASAEGYLLYFYVASDYVDGERKRHASCLAVTQDEGLFRIEPQTDWVGHLGWEI